MILAQLGTIQTQVDVETMMMMISPQESHVVHVEEESSLLSLPMSKLHVLMMIPLLTSTKELAQRITMQTHMDVIVCLTHKVLLL